MKKSLFFVLLFILMLFPFGVNAAVEFNKIEATIVEPKAGEHPVFTGDFVVSNDENEVTIENVELEWLHVQSDIKMTLEDAYQSGEAYSPMIKDYDAFISQLEQDGYILSNDYESFINGYSTGEYSYFVVDGVDEMNLEIVGLNVGNTPKDTAVRYNIYVGNEINSFVFGPFEWGKMTNDGAVSMEDDEVFQENVDYVFDFSIAADGTILEGDANKFLDIANLVDLRTKLTFNNDVVSNKDELIMKAAGRLFKVEKKYKNIVDSLSISEIEEKTEYSTTLFADLDYQLPTSIKVLIGDKELKASEYTYNSITGELVIPANLITNDLTIVANAVAIANPNTSDNIMFFVLVSVVSIIGLFGSTLYLKKEVK